MSFVDLLNQANIVKTELMAGRYAHALKASAPLIEGVADVAIGVGIQSTAVEMQAKADLKTCLDEIDKECDAAKTKHPAGAQPAGAHKASGPVGKWGDGKLIDLIKTLVSLIAPFII